MALTLVLTAGGLAVSWGKRPKLTSGKGEADLALYVKEVQRIRQGESYYDVLGSELQKRGYPIHSAFSWRTPLHLELLAHMPEPDWARYLLALGAFCAIGFSVATPFRRKEHGMVVWQALLLVFPLAITGMDPVYYFAEMWAGVGIAISVGMYIAGWPKAGVCAGIVALFFRELALPYVLISLILAWREKKKSELCIGLAGLAAFAVYYGLHAAAVSSHMPSQPPAGNAPEVLRWIQFGGLRFVLITSRVGMLMIYPFWWAALYLPFALLGLGAWRHPVAIRVLATVMAYMLAFSVIGIPSVNYYWGAVYAPLLAFGTPWALPAFKDLLRVVLPPAWTTLPEPSTN
jgi:hypothetical protein